MQKYRPVYVHAAPTNLMISRRVGKNGRKPIKRIKKYGPVHISSAPINQVISMLMSRLFARGFNLYGSLNMYGIYMALPIYACPYICTNVDTGQKDSKNNLLDRVKSWRHSY
jgi:hypothetical protein